MAPQTFVLLSGTLTFGVPLVLAVRELMMLGRGSRDGGDEPPPPLHPPLAPRPLPDCLLPKPIPVHTAHPVRILEDA